MRIAIAAFAGTIAVTLVMPVLLVPGAKAAPAAVFRDAVTQKIVPVVEGCGRGWHWVGLPRWAVRQAIRGWA